MCCCVVFGFRHAVIIGVHTYIGFVSMPLITSGKCLHGQQCCQVAPLGWTHPLKRASLAVVCKLVVAFLVCKIDAYYALPMLSAAYLVARLHTPLQCMPLT